LPCFRICHAPPQLYRIGCFPTFTAIPSTAENDQAPDPHDGPPVSLIVPSGGHSTFPAPAITSEFDRLRLSRATRNTFSHDDERWEITEILLEEKGEAGESKATPSTRSATVDTSVCEKSSRDQVPDSSSVTTSASDVHRNSVATRDADFHGDNDDDDGDFDHAEGDSRVTESEAADFVCDVQTSAPTLTQQVSPRPDSQESNKVPLGKGLGITPSHP
jgi:hypothetical protein